MPPRPGRPRHGGGFHISGCLSLLDDGRALDHDARHLDGHRHVCGQSARPARKLPRDAAQGRTIDQSEIPVGDQLYDGRKIRVLTMIDAFTRYGPAIEVRERFTGADVVATLEVVRREIGYPKSIRVDQGPSSYRRISSKMTAQMRPLTLRQTRC